MIHFQKRNDPLYDVTQIDRYRIEATVVIVVVVVWSGCICSTSMVVDVDVVVVGI